MVTFKVPAHMYTSFSIMIWYTENISSHDPPIKTFSQCKVNVSFLYMEQYKNDQDYILYTNRQSYILQFKLFRIWSV